MPEYLPGSQKKRAPGCLGSRRRVEYYPCLFWDDDDSTIIMMVECANLTPPPPRTRHGGCHNNVLGRQRWISMWSKHQRHSAVRELKPPENPTDHLIIASGYNYALMSPRLFQNQSPLGLVDGTSFLTKTKVFPGKLIISNGYTPENEHIPWKLMIQFLVQQWSQYWGHVNSTQWCNTVDGRNPVPVDMVNIPLFAGFLYIPGGVGFLSSPVCMFN